MTQPPTDQLAKQFLQRNDSTGWFEAVYAGANWDGSAVPWANLQPSPDVVQWLDRHNVDGQGKKALVVGCGLGDDAEELARRGFEVTAFDISATAIEWCQRRFPDSTVAFLVADLFDTPITWHAHFDFILEYYTIQALPPKMNEQAIEAVVRHVAPGGTILVICIGRDAEVDINGPPWPLSKAQLAPFQKYGLTEVAFEEYGHQPDSPVRRFRVEYALPEEAYSYCKQ